MKCKLIATRNLTLTSAKAIAESAQAFLSDLRILCKDKSANAKSLMGVIALSLKKGDTILLVAEGKDASLAMEEIKKHL